MPDAMLKDAIETARRVISEAEDFETQGLFFVIHACEPVMSLV